MYIGFTQIHKFMGEMVENPITFVIFVYLLKYLRIQKSLKTL